MKKNKLWLSTIPALVLAMAITGCGGRSDSAEAPSYSESKSGSAAVYYDQTMTENAAAENYDQIMTEDAAAESADMADNSTTEVDESSQTSDRKLITTVRIDSETIDFNETTGWVEARTSELGGYIESSSISVNGGYYYNEKYTDLHRADYTIRIPESKLGDFLVDVEGRTNITYKNQSVEDVTLTYTDIVARQEALETEKEALKKLMEQAESMDDLIVIQSQLTEVQYQIDSIKSQLRVYDNKIDYSTIYLNIVEVEPDNLTVTEKQSVGQRIVEGFLSSLKKTGNFLLELGISIIVNLPQLILFAAVIIVVVLIIRKSNRKKAEERQKRFNKFNVLKKDNDTENNVLNAQVQENAEEKGSVNAQDNKEEN